jgi:hypothetical protein
MRHIVCRRAERDGDGRSRRVAGQEAATAMGRRTNREDQEDRMRIPSRRTPALTIHRVFQPDPARAAAALVLLAGGRRVRAADDAACNTDCAVPSAGVRDGQQLCGDAALVAVATDDMSTDVLKGHTRGSNVGGEPVPDASRFPLSGAVPVGAAASAASQDWGAQENSCGSRIHVLFCVYGKSAVHRDPL